MVSSYCKRIVKSGIFSWRFKIEDCTNFRPTTGGKFMIGIWSGVPPKLPQDEDEDTTSSDEDDGEFIEETTSGTRIDEEPPTESYFTEYGKGYGFDPVGAILTNREGHTDDTLKYGVKCKNGTIIEMILNLNELTLSYKIDGKSYGKAFDVEKHGYRAAVYMMEINDSITLLY